MTKPPLISVVMPAYNAGVFIREAIDGILNQSEKNFELIIINDGSRDKTEAAVASYTSDKIRYCANSKNLGISKTRNKMIEMARGEFIANADSDDISHPERLAIQAGFLQTHPEVGVVGARIRGFEGQSPAFGRLQAEKIKVRLSPEQIRSRLVFNDSSVMANPATMIRKSVLVQHRIAYGDNFPVAEDFHLYQQLGLVTDMVELDAELCLYRVHSGNISKDRKITRKYSLQTRIAFLKNNFNVDISDVFDGEGQVKDAQKFAHLNEEVEKVVKALVNNPRYDTEMLQNGATKFLYNGLRGLEHRKSDHRAIYAVYRQSEVLRRLGVNRKLRLYLKAFLFPRGW